MKKRIRQQVPKELYVTAGTTFSALEEVENFVQRIGKKIAEIKTFEKCGLTRHLVILS